MSQNAFQRVFCLLCLFEVLVLMLENLSTGLANIMGADQPAHLRSLISAFVVQLKAGIISTLTTSEIF